MAAKRKRSTGSRNRHRDPRPRTLAVDIGGSKVKAAILDARGRMLTERVRAETPSPAKPKLLLDAIEKLVEPLGDYERISLGFPGIVRDGIVYTAPNLGNEHYRRYDIAGALERRFGRPARVLNDADIHGLGVISGKGIEVVITLGTGFGSALFLDGRLGPHIQLAHHPSHRDGKPIDEFGDEARKAVGRKKWSRRIERAIDQLRDLTNFDHLYIGGGNADKLSFDLPDDISIVDNEQGILGGVRLWEI